MPGVMTARVLTGPREGEVLELTENEVESLSAEEFELFNAALDDVITALDHVSSELRLTIDAVRLRVGDQPNAR